ncbi:MAG: hypothetical protein JRN20_00065 [Nitrososphaerota archaeon]|nr:hypothetical protein [Nitrososphaerota archaeon]MDG6921796.1 hypothetical protein [Nitrososphaerota archaeon]
MAWESQLQDVKREPIVDCDSEEINNVCVAINSLREESMQIAELLKLEEFYSKEIVNELKQIMAPKKGSFHVNPWTMLEPNFEIVDAFVNYQGMVSFLNERKEVVFKKPLAEFQRDIFLRVIDEILPEVKNLLNAGEEKNTQGLSAIRRISVELKKIIYGYDDEIVADTTTPKKRSTKKKI